MRLASRVVGKLNCFLVVHWRRSEEKPWWGSGLGRGLDHDLVLGGGVPKRSTRRPMAVLQPWISQLIISPSLSIDKKSIRSFSEKHHDYDHWSHYLPHKRSPRSALPITRSAIDHPWCGGRDVEVLDAWRWLVPGDDGVDGETKGEDDESWC